MIEKIKSYLAEREAINTKLERIMGHCDYSPINMDFLDKEWQQCDNIELRLQVDDSDLTDDYYSFTISSLGARGKELFMGEDGGYTYVMAHEHEDWNDTQIFVLNSKNKVE